MRSTRDGSLSVPCATVNKALKLMVFIAVIQQGVIYVSSMPQRSSVFFPSNSQQDTVKNPNNHGNGIVQILTPPNSINHNGNFNNDNNGLVGSAYPTEFQVGTTGISCNRPGDFVMAPDGCNRCFCAGNGQLSSACSRALCPPGFPSSNQSQFNL